jgi:hypothetical protein
VTPKNDIDVFDFSHHISSKMFSNQHPNLIVNGCVISNCGRHAGGVLILEHPERLMPVIRIRGHYQSPWQEGLTLKTLEGLGFLKFDCLGLDTLRIIQRCVTYILQKQGIKDPTFDQVRDWYDTNLHPDKLDMTDQKVYKNVYHDGKFPAVFQFTQCLDERSQISMADGSFKDIVSVKVGDYVQSYDQSIDEFVTAEVNDVHDNGIKECIEIVLENGHKVVCTADHMILTSNKGWVYACDLTEDDDILSNIEMMT